MRAEVPELEAGERSDRSPLAGRGWITTIEEGSGTGHGWSTGRIERGEKRRHETDPSVRIRTTLALKTG